MGGASKRTLEDRLARISRPGPAKRDRSRERDARKEGRGRRGRASKSIVGVDSLDDGKGQNQGGRTQSKLGPCTVKERRSCKKQYQKELKDCQKCVGSEAGGPLGGVAAERGSLQRTKPGNTGASTGCGAEGRILGLGTAEDGIGEISRRN